MSTEDDRVSHFSSDGFQRPDDEFLMWAQGEEFAFQDIMIHDVRVATLAIVCLQVEQSLRDGSVSEHVRTHLGFRFHDMAPDLAVEVALRFAPVAVGFSNCVGVADRHLRSLSALGLRYLEIEVKESPQFTMRSIGEFSETLRCLEVTGPKSGYMLDWDNLALLRQLEVLDIGGSPLNLQCAITSMDGLRNLVRLDLLTESQIVEVLSARTDSLSGLRNLWIRPVSGGERILLNALSTADVKVLRLDHCDLAEVIWGLATAAHSSVTHLRLCECDVDGESINAAPSVQHSSLQCVTIEYSSGASELDTKALVSRLPNLQRLFVDRELRFKADK